LAGEGFFFACFDKGLANALAAKIGMDKEILNFGNTQMAKGEIFWESVQVNVTSQIFLFPSQKNTAFSFLLFSPALLEITSFGNVAFGQLN